jgi:hypothetical protein
MVSYLSSILEIYINLHLLLYLKIYSQMLDLKLFNSFLLNYYNDVYIILLSNLILRLSLIEIVNYYKYADKNKFKRVG